MCRGQQRDRCDWNKDTQSQGLAERGRPTTASLRSHSRIWYLTRRKTSVLWNHQRSPLLRVGTLLPLCCFIDPTVANGERGRGCPFLLNKKRKLKPRERRQLVIQQNPWWEKGKGQKRVLQELSFFLFLGSSVYLSSPRSSLTLGGPVSRESCEFSHQDVCPLPPKSQGLGEAEAGRNRLILVFQGW